MNQWRWQQDSEPDIAQGSHGYVSVPADALWTIGSRASGTEIKLDKIVSEQYFLDNYI